METPSRRHPPLRDLKDVEALERVPLEARIFSWDVNDWIRRGCALDPGKPALHYVENGDPAAPCVTLAYGELQRRANQAANLFRSLGVDAGDAVFFLLPTLPQLFAVTFGALAAGIACGANWMLKPAQLLALVRASRAKVVVALGPTPGYEIWENVQAIRADLPAGVRLLSVRGPGGERIDACDFDTLAKEQPAERLGFERTARADDIAAYVHSGGTTGSPRLVKIAHRGLAYKCWANALVMAHGPKDVIFADYPMFHIAGFFGRCVLPVATGSTVLVPSPLGARDKRFVANYWKFVERFRVTVLSGVPTTLSVLAKNPPAGEDISSLRPYMSTGSSAMPAEVARELQAAIGVRVLATYGATEFTQNVTQAPRDGDPKYGSAGLRLPYTQVKVVKLDAARRIEQECAVDEIGSVVMKGPGITPGYVDPRDDKGLYLPGGWIDNGDLGRIDAQGYLWLTGRARDLIIRGGHNIDPTLIEETLRRHPAVLLAAAVGKPDAYAGELPVAYVQLVDAAAAAAAEIEAFAREHISERAAAPKEIVVLERMPLTDIGKPDKARLRYDAAERAFRAALAARLGPSARISVEVGPDPLEGTVARLRASLPDVPGAELEKQIHDAMKPYCMPYRIHS